MDRRAETEMAPCVPHRTRTESVQKAFHRLPEDSTASYRGATTALQERFEPKSKKTRYQAELEARRKARGRMGRFRRRSPDSDRQSISRVTSRGQGTACAPGVTAPVGTPANFVQCEAATAEDPR